MFHRFSQSKLPCCFLDIQHPFVWYIAQGTGSSMAAKNDPKWEHNHRKLVEGNWKNRRIIIHVLIHVLCLAAETKVGMPRWKQVLSEKDSSGLATQLTKSMKLSHRSSNQPCLQGSHSTYPWARQEGRGRTESQLKKIFPHKKWSWAKHHILVLGQAAYLVV